MLVEGSSGTIEHLLFIIDLISSVNVNMSDHSLSITLCHKELG